MVLGETGVRDVADIIKERMINFWQKLSIENNQKYSNILYLFIRQSQERASNRITTDWFESIKSTLTTAGFGNAWNVHNRSYIDTKKQLRPIHDLKREEQWKEAMTAPECTLYSTFKKSYGAESYISTLENFDAAMIARLRTGNSNHMPTNKHRYSAQADKSYPLCEADEDADEAHYLFNCIHLSEARPDFSAFNNCLTRFMENQNIGHLRRTARFLRLIDKELKNPPSKQE